MAHAHFRFPSREITIFIHYVSLAGDFSFMKLFAFERRKAFFEKKSFAWTSNWNAGFEVCVCRSIFLSRIFTQQSYWNAHWNPLSMSKTHFANGSMNAWANMIIVIQTSVSKIQRYCYRSLSIWEFVQGFDNHKKNVFLLSTWKLEYKNMKTTKAPWIANDRFIERCRTYWA